ncbi:MAG: hypothetical protein ABI039_03020, partial [Vicinamibacterales bacterium]
MKLLAIVATLALSISQVQPLQFPPPASRPDAVADTRDFLFLPAFPGAQLIQSSRINGALEVKSADADDEAVLAGTSYLKKTYILSSGVTPAQFVAHYRDGLFAAGWKLISSTKVDTVPMPEGIVSVAAHFMTNGRNIYALVSRLPEGPYDISVADVGDEAWASMLTRDCRIRIPSLHFDLDRPTLRTYESTPTLDKLAVLLKSKAA